MVLDERLGVDEVQQLQRSPVSDVYAQIEQDLIFASSILEPTSTIKGKATKGAALALLGKAYLYQQKWSDAVSTFDQIINNGWYSLIPDYADLFTVANENHAETVFDVQYSGLEGGGYGCLVCLEGNAGPGFQGIRQYNGCLLYTSPSPRDP